jgi:hypothetical protein
MKWLRRLIAQNVILCLSLLGVSFIFLSHTHSTQELQSSQSKLIYRQRNSLRRLDRECRLLEKQKLESEIFGSLSSAVVAPKEAEKQEVMKTIRIAKREKIIRDNVLYFPELQQMWCLVPKVLKPTAIFHYLIDSKLLTHQRVQLILRNYTIFRLEAVLGVKLYWRNLIGTACSCG